MCIAVDRYDQTFNENICYIYIYEYIQPELAPPSHFHLRIQTLEVLRREVEGMALNVCHQLQDAGVKVATPLKFNMEPENQPLGMEILILETIMFRFHVRLWKCIFLLIRKGLGKEKGICWDVQSSLKDNCNDWFFSSVILINVHGAAKSAKVFHVFSAEWGSVNQQPDTYDKIDLVEMLCFQQRISAAVCLGRSGGCFYMCLF